MKKILLLFLSILCLIPLFTITVNAEEENTVETSEFQEVVYSYEVQETGEKGTITLISETECELSDNSGVFLRTTYTIEGDLLIIDKSNEQVYFRINDTFELEFIGFFELPSEEKVYTVVQEDGTAILTIKSETVYELAIVTKEETLTTSGTYEFFNSIMKLYEDGELKAYFVLDDINMTFDIYEGPFAEIVVQETKGGEVYTELLQYLPGEKVIIYPNPNLLYDLQSIYVNGIEVLPLEDGSYEITVVEGENLITSSFVVCDEKVKEVADLLEQIQNKDWKNLFTVNNLLTLISWIITTFCSSGFFITLIKMKKYKNLTLLEVMENVNKTLKVDVSKTVKEILIDVLDPILEKIANNMTEISNNVQTLKKVTILSQENTPESRLAILNELDKTTDQNQELISMAKNMIQEEVNKIEKAIEDRDNSIQELKDINNNESEIPHL